MKYIKSVTIPKASEIANGILAGNITLLSRAITIIESTNSTKRKIAVELLELLSVKRSSSIRIAITGAPGVGKSTFIEALGLHLCALGHKVAVLAIDPSSSLSKGSIMGDKTRMDELANHHNAYIRPSSSGGSLGGVTDSTPDAILLCEAAGFDVIFIETVGVGQNEIAAKNMCDFFLLLQLPSGGDELQGIKKGVVELADLVVINKADGNTKNAAIATQADYSNALRLINSSNQYWRPTAMLCSAIDRIGIVQVWEQINKFSEIMRSNNYFEENRKKQLLNRLDYTFKNQLLATFLDNKDVKTEFEKISNAISNGQLAIYDGVLKLITIFKESKS